jgi:hypothetical protein
MPGHGPASALPGHAANDNRRVINVVVNNLGEANDPTSWYEPSTGTADQAIVSATQAGANSWNNATDQYGNKTGYFFNVTVSQTADDLAHADILVTKESLPTGICAGTQPYTGPAGPVKMKLPPSAPSAPRSALLEPCSMI